MRNEWSVALEGNAAGGREASTSRFKKDRNLPTADPKRRSRRRRDRDSPPPVVDCQETKGQARVFEGDVADNYVAAAFAANAISICQRDVVFIDSISAAGGFDAICGAQPSVLKTGIAEDVAVRAELDPIATIVTCRASADGATVVNNDPVKVITTRRTVDDNGIVAGSNAAAAVAARGAILDRAAVFDGYSVGRIEVGRATADGAAVTDRNSIAPEKQLLQSVHDLRSDILGRRPTRG